VTPVPSVLSAPSDLPCQLAGEISYSRRQFFAHGRNVRLLAPAYLTVAGTPPILCETPAGDAKVWRMRSCVRLIDLPSGSAAAP
jgi:hypothetical protein